MSREASTDNPSAFEVVSQLVAALAAQDTETMESLHAEDYVVDWAYGDAFENPPPSAEESAAFFPAWFIGFDEIDYEAKRTGRGRRQPLGLADRVQVAPAAAHRGACHRPPLTPRHGRRRPCAGELG